MFKRPASSLLQTSLRSSRLTVNNTPLRSFQSRTSSSKASTASKQPTDAAANDSSTTKKLVKPKKGFNSLSKVPSTVSIRAKDILLDNLFQGYKPLTIPLNPPAANFKKNSAVVYLEFDENLENFIESQEPPINASQDMSSNLSSNPLNEDKNLSRYQYSKYSFNKELEIQSDYDDYENSKLKSDSKKISKHLHKKHAASLSSKFTSKLKERDSNAGKGRSRLSYSKNNKNKDKKN